MAKKKYSKLLAAGLAVTGAVQVSTSVPANALGPGSAGQTVIKSEDIKKDRLERTTKDTGTYIEFKKGDVTNLGLDPNREMHNETSAGGRRFSRYTHEDGTPYTGLYKSITGTDGYSGNWYVLDENGYYMRDPMKPQYAWIDGKLCADFLNYNGPCYNDAEGKYYLGHETGRDGGSITYMVFNDWVNNGSTWYRSDEKGVAYRNQWFKDPSTGKWYYFGDDCKMVRNKLVDGYYIGADGVWVQ